MGSREVEMWNVYRRTGRQKDELQKVISEAHLCFQLKRPRSVLKISRLDFLIVDLSDILSFLIYPVW